MGQLLTLIGYSSGFPDIDEEDELNKSHDFPHNDRMNLDKVLSFVGSLV